MSRAYHKRFCYMLFLFVLKFHILIYISDLLNVLHSNQKRFTEDTFLLSVVHVITTTTVNLNHDLSKVSEWAAQWTINFNSDSCKQSQELLFSNKNNFQAISIIKF